MKLKWTIPDGWVRGPHREYSAGDYRIHNELRLVAPRRYGEVFVVSYRGDPFDESPKLLEAQRSGQRHADVREQED